MSESVGAVKLPQRNPACVPQAIKAEDRMNHFALLDRLFSEQAMERTTANDADEGYEFRFESNSLPELPSSSAPGSLSPIQSAMLTFTTVTLPPILALADSQRQVDDAGGQYGTLNTDAEGTLHRAVMVYVRRKIQLGEFRGPPLWLNGTPSRWDSDWQLGINNGCPNPMLASELAGYDPHASEKKNGPFDKTSFSYGEATWRINPDTGVPYTPPELAALGLPR